MGEISRFFKKLAMLVGRKKFESELEEEMTFHREMTEEEIRRHGGKPDDARYAARRQFGNAMHMKDQSRDVMGFQFETVLQDFRFAFRQLRKNLGFAATAIFVLALGICASVSIFAFVDAALLKPLPYRDPGSLVGVYESVAMIERSNLSYPDYLDWKKQNKSFHSLDIYSGTGYLVKSSSGTLPAAGARVSDGFFRTLGVAPILGRDFYDGEDLPTAPRTVMLTYGAWQKWFGGKPDVVGQAITLSDISYTVIGVLPREFQFAPRGAAEFWTTMHATGSCDLRRSCHGLYGVARLAAGVSVGMARAEMRSIAKQLEAEYPDSNRGQGAEVVTLGEAIVGNVRPILLVLLAGAGLLLLIACVNVASLLLVRSESRKREIAVRGALGASLSRLIRQFVTEGLLLVALGSAIGLLFAQWVMQLLAGLIPKDMKPYAPYLDGIGLNLRILGFAAAIALLAALLFAITPLVRLRFREMRDGLNESSRGSSGRTWGRLGANLVAVELAIAVVLLVGAGLLGKSFYRLLHVDMGFHPDHLATLQIAVPEKTYGQEEQAAALGKEIVRRMETLPGVQSAGVANLLAMSGNGNTDWIRFVGRPFGGEHNETNQRDVSANYFRTLQAKLLRGRFFTESDDATKPKVMIINQALARQYYGNQDPIGQKIGDLALSPQSIKEIVGVVEDIREGSLDVDIWPTEYLPFNQSPDRFYGVVVRTSQAEASVLPSMVAMIHQIDPNIGTMGETTMMETINGSLTAYMHRSSAWLVGGFAVLALVLGVVGLYGVISYSVGQRTREIGVRMALGAQAGSVYRLVLTEAGWLTAIGICLGLACSLAAGTMMGKILFGVRSWDIPILAGVAVVLGAASMLASYVPAHRAASLDPVEVLRAE